MVPTCDPQPSAPTTPDVKSHGGLTLSKRGTRTSFTFRKIRHEPCCCGENHHPPLFEDFAFCHITPSSFLTSSLSLQPSPRPVTVKKLRSQHLDLPSLRCPPATLTLPTWRRSTSTECTTPSPPTSAALATRPGRAFATSCPRSPLAACWLMWAVEMGNTWASTRSLLQ